MIRGSLRGWVLAAFASTLLSASCGPTPIAKCQASNCAGCCAEDNTCVAGNKQSFSACGKGGARCRTCLPQQICSALSCIAGEGGGDGGGGEAGGAGGGTAGGSAAGGGGGGGAPCGATGQMCCVGSGSGCLLGLFCVNNTCGTMPPPDGGGGGSAGGAGGGGGAGGAAGGGGAGGGVALAALGDACVVGSGCETNFCQAFGFQDGYCTKACTSNADCPAGSACGRNPGGGNMCLKSCPTAGLSPGGCRTGYVCEKFQSSMDNSPVCFPACSSAAGCIGGALACDARGFCCGVNGAACCNNVACDSPNTCDAVTKHCKSLPATNRPAGEACSTAGQCAGNICIAEILNMAPVCSPVCNSGGYCTQDCTSAACPAGSTCSDYTFTGKRCAANCAWDGGQGDCRNNYVCDRYLVQGSTQSTCYKKCFADGGCATNTACDNGFCCGKQGFRCCSGATKCPGGGACNALDYCQ